MDMERLRCVYLGWAPAKYEDIEGFLHWGGSYLCVNPYDTSIGFNEDFCDYNAIPQNILPVGDHIIFYPAIGNNSVYSSTRAESQRIGLEDLVLIEMLKKTNRVKALEIVDELFTNYSCYEKDITKYRRVKKELLENLK